MTLELTSHRPPRRSVLAWAGFAVLALPLRSQAPAERRVVAPESAHFLHVVNGEAKVVEHAGRRAVHLVPSPETKGQDLDMLAILDQPLFQDGEIQLELSGAPLPTAPPDSRGFVGLSFRAGEEGEWSEIFYLRPTNGRADEQLRRNRSVQYASHPDYPWHRLREESPGKYESYVDLQPGVWTSVRIVVAGNTARLHVNGAEQPCLVVTDLKRGATAGRIALWAHVETKAYFGTLTVTPR